MIDSGNTAMLNAKKNELNMKQVISNFRILKCC